MKKMQVHTNLRGLMKWAWRKNLRGFFIFNGRGKNVNKFFSVEKNANTFFSIEKISIIFLQ